MIKDYPIKINNVDLPWGDNPPSESRDTLENVNVTEAGTDVCQVQRKGSSHFPFLINFPKPTKIYFMVFISTKIY